MYIGGAFMDSQLLYIIPFAHGYARQKKIRKLVFEKKIPDRVRKSPHISEILREYIVVEKCRSEGIKRYIEICFAVLFQGVSALKLALRSTRTGLLEKDVSWYELQLRHAVWDQTLQGVDDGMIQLPLIRRFVSALRVLKAVKKALALHSNEGVRAAVLGHTVYAGRGLLAVFRLKEIDVIAHSATIIHRTSLNADIGHLTMPYSDWMSFYEMVDPADVAENWKKRAIGISNYSDAENASIGRRSLSSTTPKNVIFLHIFRDSPFNHIDKNRIFSDYVQWVLETFKVLLKSNERWLIKLHPSAGRWGEDQVVWLKAIGKILFSDKWPENIEIDEIGYSNIELLQNAKRIVTYRGTVHLEAACFGIKPIIISEASLSSFNENLVHKPISLEDYERLLLVPENSRQFCLSEVEKNYAKTLLFIREELLSFGKDIDDFHVYRSDSPLLHAQHFDAVLNGASANSIILKKIGANIANGVPRSAAFNFFDKWSGSYQRD